ncbi:hypothetical protein HispidOSU_010371, partial [Sigmodon hispidus]
AHDPSCSHCETECSSTTIFHPHTQHQEGQELFAKHYSESLGEICTLACLFISIFLPGGLRMRLVRRSDKGHPKEADRSEFL